MTSYYVAVIEYNDADTEQHNVVNQSRTYDNLESAERMADAYNVNLDHEHYYTMIYELEAQS
jgi:hypothetical protein